MGRPAKQGGGRHLVGGPVEGRERIGGQPMRYKVVPLSVRTSAPVARDQRFTSDSFRVLVAALLIPVILIPLVAANAAASITLAPNAAMPGGTGTATGVGLLPKSRGELAFDGKTTGMLRFRLERGGRM